MNPDQAMLLVAIVLLVMTGLGTFFTVRRNAKNKKARRELIESLTKEVAVMADRVSQLEKKKK